MSDWRDPSTMTEEEVAVEIKMLNDEIKASQRKQIAYLTLAVILQAIALIIHMLKHHV